MGFLRVVTRPAHRVRRLPKPRGASRVGSGWRSKIHGFGGRVGSGGLKISRIGSGSGRIGSGSGRIGSGSGRIGSGSGRIGSGSGSGHLGSTRPEIIDPTHEQPCL